jgi:hypothetical protein
MKPFNSVHKGNRIGRSALAFLLLVVGILGSSFELVDPPKTKSAGLSEDRVSDPQLMRLREWIIDYAQEFKGTRYRYAGRSPKTGFDCSGFTSYVLHEFELNASSSSSTQSTQGVKIALDDVLPGDLVFFGSKKHVQHVAMVVECGPEGIICVHSTSSRGVIIENISTSKYWRPRILFARDIITDQIRSKGGVPVTLTVGRQVSEAVEACNEQMAERLLRRP